ncbi:hypothetical protein C8Q80DRAFT_601166 [Daedaleopsis nitida]|nr:hypothetical protein C8Q80DRAFT_601166 [Daedaleopsis nitida]
MQVYLLTATPIHHQQAVRPSREKWRSTRCTDLWLLTSPPRRHRSRNIRQRVFMVGTWKISRPGRYTSVIRNVCATYPLAVHIHLSMDFPRTRLWLNSLTASEIDVTRPHFRSRSLACERSLSLDSDAQLLSGGIFELVHRVRPSRLCALSHDGSIVI